MTQKSKKHLDYTVCTYAVEQLVPSRDAMQLCEQISDGIISADVAVEKILQLYDLKQGNSNGWQF